ncbi:hypothetical protein [Aestuariispira insulae]|uniref:Uncharacterized protein n=1 Tax=Aestuariispira insulae TaxID=1461337 RepID=A0A3D9HJR7_9PROT|nr:hypothetical protein [Aestuariispira insulae]RED49747.1 hypothetical protein DFP90_105118 [Aestuariispira insulae]
MADVSESQTMATVDTLTGFKGVVDGMKDRFYLGKGGHRRIEFLLEQQNRKTGERRKIPVQMGGLLEFSGQVGNGHIVEVFGEMREGVLHADHLVNVSLNNSVLRPEKQSSLVPRLFGGIAIFGISAFVVILLTVIAGFVYLASMI